ncbi:MAG: hypothetical protein ABI227_04770 [Rhodanobacter sp.]
MKAIDAAVGAGMARLAGGAVVDDEATVDADDAGVAPTAAGGVDGEQPASAHRLKEATSNASPIFMA